MSSIKSYSSVTVIDQMDLGNLQSYLTSNQAANVIYDPNDGIYTPDWTTSNLVITPVINFNGEPLALNTNGLTISYQRRDGSDAATNLTTGETVTNGVLTVSQNKLSSSLTGIITYICNISYTDPRFNVPITTQNTITFSLITSASEIKSAYITGESTFLYDSSRSLVGVNKITLSATVTKVAVSKWQYLNGSGNFVDFPNTNNPSISSPTLDVYASEPDIWVNGRTATIKLVTSDLDIYDIHQITKIYDGAPGISTISAVLSNQNHYVPCDDQGNVLSWTGASTQIFVYEGGTDVTSSWTITPQYGSGIQGAFVNNIFTPTALNYDTYFVDFECQKSGYSNITVRYSLTKAKAGVDGNSATIYELSPSAYAVNLDEDGNFSPASVTFSAYKTVGNNAKELWPGKFEIAETTDGSTYVVKETTIQSSGTRTYTPSNSNVKSIRCRLYEDSTDALLDEQTVVITRDGATGDNGIDGTSVGLSNYQDVIPCNENGTAAGERDLAIPYYAYSGITRLPVSASVASTLPSGVTTKSNANGTASSDGLLILHVANGATFGGANVLTGEVTIRLTIEVNGVSSTKDQMYRWTKNVKAADGENTQYLQIYSEDGGVIRNSAGSTTIKVRYMNGSHEVTPTSIQWYKFQGGAYTALSGKTNASLLVTASMVDDYALFKATAIYDNISCDAYYNVDDVSDPVVVTTLASVREFIDGEGCGAVFTRIHRNGTELDPLKSTVFSSTTPTGAKSGDYYYHLDTSAKTVTLKRYNGSSWTNVSENYIYNYSYYRLDKNGQSLDTSSPYKTTRCVYIDPSIIGNTGDTMQFICEVNE